MHLDVSDLPAQLALNPRQFVGIPIALIGAVFLSFGAQFQHRGVAKVERQTKAAGNQGLDRKQIFRLLGRPSWVAGTLMLFVAILAQLTSLGFAPLIVVQPLGAVALVVTGILNSRVTHHPLNRASIRAIVMCVGGVAVFVVIAAFTAREVPIGEGQLIVILIILVVVLAAFLVIFLRSRKGFPAVAYVIGAGVLYGFVATLAKVVIARVMQGDFDVLTAVCVVALLAAVGLGAYFVQNAYASGPPDLVIAGLTVIDPLVAVTIGIVVLQEASQAPIWAMLIAIAAAAVAIVGVFQLSKHHPQLT